MRYATLAQAEDHIAMLEAQIEASGFEPVKIPTWAGAFSLNQVILLQALERAWPNYMTFAQLDAIIPTRDHSTDRGMTVVRMMVHHIRMKAGRHVIEAVRSVGYRMGNDFHKMIVSGG